ncbi:hybrid sensor histidine kinase/response regulator [Actibacterium lipolyticum]|uniref:histidine kinase n=1 Tax=Actibacterium lipolyticum TaxID=1524263 RepID=A0A238KVL2_9RHOB|nr:PAS-domain containing protein [Actibacterium lipolyticum]SMX46212.1 Blue-light-activated protein [Actibacterium lipolyticum]
MASSETERTRMTEAGLNLIQQALSIYDADLTLVISNRPFREMFNLPVEHVTPGASFEGTIRYLVECGEYGEVDDPEGFIATRVEQARAFQAHYMERTRANGRTISVEGSPLPQGGWVTVYTDITGIKRQEKLLRARSVELSGQLLSHAEQLSQTNRELAASNAALEEAKRQLTEMEARTRMVTEMMPAHIAHVGPDGRYTYSNRKLNAVMPSRPSDIVGSFIGDALGDEAFSRIQPNLDRALAGEASVFEFNHEESGRRIRAAFTPEIGPDSTVLGVYILSMDVTDEAQARAALAQTRKRELAAQLTSGLAHDFANLLTIILGLQGRLARIAPTADAQELITATQAAARRGGDLLNRIASITGRRAMHPTPTDLPAFLADLHTMAAPTLPNGVTLTVATDLFPSPLMLDAGGLQDSLLNLILNARDAIGDAPGQITLSARSLGDTWVEITVADTGPGFSEEALTRALDPFFTTKGEEGSGLGLSMVYDVTKLCGGRLKLSNTDHGALVTLSLPLRRASEDTEPKLVLLVEDSPDIREIVREMLTQIGHNVIEAASADEAEQLAEIPGIDLILSDIMLGGSRTGFDLLNALADGQHPARTLLMTSLPPSDEIRRAAAARYPLITKPFTQDALAGFLTTEQAA